MSLAAISMKQSMKIGNLFKGIKLNLRNEGEFFSELSDHQGEKGRLNESHLKNVLRRHLPEKFGLGTGFIVSSRTINKKDNPQLDIVIHDNITNAPLYTSEAFSVFPIESVYGYIEVKTTLTKAELEKAFVVNAKIRNIAASGDKQYMEGPIYLSPRFYIFAYKSNVSIETLEENVRQSYVGQGDAHAHGIYVLDKDILIARKARYDPAIVDLEVIEGASAFPAFIIKVIEHCETMIPERCLTIDTTGVRLPRSTTLPLGNIARYLTEPQADEESDNQHG
jgi:hypothetical protein